MGTRECTACGEAKSIMEFPKNGKHKDGSTRYRTDCKVCYNITRKLTKRKAVTKFLNNTKHRTGEEDTYTLQDWKDVMLHFSGRCAYCRRIPSRRQRLTRDHVIAVMHGGPTTRENILPACRSCNSRKGNKDWITWFEAQGFYSDKQMELIKAWISME